MEQICQKIAQHFVKQRNPPKKLLKTSQNLNNYDHLDPGNLGSLKLPLSASKRLA